MESSTESGSGSSLSPPPTPQQPLIKKSGDGSHGLFSRLFHPLYYVFQLFIPSGTFFKFFLAALIPAISDQVIPLFYTGQIPNQSALAISSQFMFISIILEVVQETISNSLFYFIGQNYKDRRRLALQGLKICLLILLICGFLLTTGLLLFVDEFLNVIDTPVNITIATKTFLWSSSFSFPIILMNSALTNYFYITTSSLLITAQLFQVVWSFLTSYLLFGGQSFSLHWNVEQLGYYKIIQSSVSLLNNILFLLVVEKISICHFLYKIPLLKNIRQNAKILFAVSFGNMGDSICRNFFYFMVTLKFINQMGEVDAGAWNLLNGIIWGLLLIPTNTVANYVRVKIGHATGLENNGGDSGQEKNPEVKRIVGKIGKESAKSLTAWLLLIGTVSTLIWPTLANYFSPENKLIADKSTEMFHHIGWIYIFFSFNNSMDSLFFGLGRTKYIFLQSLITNLVVYFIPWILYLCNILQPSYWWVMGLYLAGMLVDFILTGLFSIRVWNSL